MELSRAFNPINKYETWGQYSQMIFFLHCWSSAKVYISACLACFLHSIGMYKTGVVSLQILYLFVELWYILDFDKLYWQLCFCQMSSSFFLISCSTALYSSLFFFSRAQWILWKYWHNPIHSHHILSINDIHWQIKIIIKSDVCVRLKVWFYCSSVAIWSLFQC